MGLAARIGPIVAVTGQAKGSGDAEPQAGYRCQINRTGIEESLVIGDNLTRPFNFFPLWSNG